MSLSNAWAQALPISASRIDTKPSASQPLKLALAAPNAEPLEPELAFQLSARKTELGVQIQFTIAKGYYLYADKIKVSVAAPNSLGTYSLPKGLSHFDQTFQKTLETYRDQLQFFAPIQMGANAATVQITVQSQGCADIGICYPPQSQTLELAVFTTSNGERSWTNANPLAPSKNVTVPSAVPVSLADTLSSGSLWSVLITFIGLGLLLAFTPCVLPMLPIVSSIVVGGPAAGRWRGLGLSMAYVLGMALVFTALGVAAGFAGQGLASTLQAPWALTAFALLMVVLAGAQFGWYELQLPQSWLNRLNALGGKGGAWLNAGVLGALSGLMVGPCLTAPLAAALAFIAQTGEAFRGGFALFALALGMGSPLLLIGAGGGAWLPNAGPWMERIKHAFGAGLLAVAWWMLAPILPQWLGTLGWAVWLLGVASALGAFEAANYGWQRLLKSMGLGLAAWALAILLGMAQGRFDALQPLLALNSSPATRPALAFDRVDSLATLEAALASAKQLGKPVMLDFYADWCVSCLEMERFTFSDPKVAAALQGFVLIKADVTHNTPNDTGLLRRFGIFGPPSTVFFTKNGKELSTARLTGYIAAEPFLQHLRKLLETNT